jgi:hypothetical protein
MLPANAGLVQAASRTDPGDVAAVSRLRRGASPALVNAALELGTARRKAATKFPPAVADRIIADPQSVEMASSSLVADHKAVRFREVFGQGARVLDLCCGMGGDAMALTRAGLNVLGVDRDPARAWMCGLNAPCEVRTADVLDPDLPDGPFHLDPSRREESAGRRVFDLSRHEPRPEVWRFLIAGRRNGAIKLGPGVDAEKLAAELPPGTPHELEFISERGRLTQAVAWIGSMALSPGCHRATLVTGLATHSIAGLPGEPPLGPLGRYLIETDASVERANLLSELCRTEVLLALHPRLGLLTADRPCDSPMAASFEVLAHMPWNPKRVRAWLRDHDGGIVEVKTRAKTVDPDAVQMELRGEGATAYAVFVLRIGNDIQAIITRRAAARSGGEAVD